MSTVFRIILIVIALLAFWFVIRQIRKSQLQIPDSISWLFFGLICVILALFPQLAEDLAGLLGVQSPVNLVFLIIIALLILRVFRLSLALSKLDTKVKELAQTIAIKEYEDSKKAETEENKL